MPKIRGIFLLDPRHFDHAYPVDEVRRLQRLLEIEPRPYATASDPIAAARLRQAEVILGGWGMPRLDAELLAAAPALKAVFYAGGTVRGFMTETAWTRGIVVVSAAAANAVPVAEYCVAQILFCLKDGWRRALAVRKHRAFPPAPEEMPGTFRSTVGLVSLGRIARLLREKLRGYDLEILAWDPLVSAAEAKALGVALCPLEELFARSDVVSLHSPLLPETRQMIGAAHFARMKRGASFINTSRGAIVDEAALVAVLRARPDLFAVLDVTSPEPPPPDSPLYELDNAIVTPHMAGCERHECRRLGELVRAELERYLRGDALLHAVTREQFAVTA